ncbi:MADS-box domain-containing protein [Citrus sinensis]|uniref:MADS-box domain-containing protein n=1 Tax=Citrus sinensis TaxID=2711 RepID=A0ACB8HX34_CITSI|nr:MADS-box domain-containing protein [Citrus sinensis]
MAGKKTKRRQKIEMKKIENEDDRLITFSKRRSGIYKKATIHLCQPSVKAIANRFLGMSQLHNDNIHPLVKAYRHARINELNQQHNDLLRQLDEEKEQEKMLKQMRRLNLQELLQLDSAVDDLHQTFLAKINEKTAAAAASSSVAPPMYFHNK